ncbi:hypothetical protein KB976_000315 [Vibrio parahaemolyticus]|nr:hypothetical protein [Vibrio parahaemolyticus]
MKILKIALLTTTSVLLMAGCEPEGPSQDFKDSKTVKQQQSQYAASQPVPVYDWSLPRQLVIELYNIQNIKAATHSVWRSDYGTIEGDCPSMGFGIPYDTSLTNPLVSVDRSGNRSVDDGVDYSLTSVGQPEPNGVYASQNTSATWVMCVDDTGVISPVYIESKVTVYPYSVNVDYDKNRVTKAGKSNIAISSEKLK